MPPVAWPPTLPKIQAGFGAQPNSNLNITPMGTGNPKVALLDDVFYYTINGSMIVTRDQLLIFNAFLRDDIDFGVTSFLYVHPITLAETLFKLITYGEATQIGPHSFQFPITLQEVP